MSPEPKTTLNKTKNNFHFFRMTKYPIRIDENTMSSVVNEKSMNFSHQFPTHLNFPGESPL